VLNPGESCSILKIKSYDVHDVMMLEMEMLMNDRGRAPF
jgi:hypothetical protein